MLLINHIENGRHGEEKQSNHHKARERSGCYSQGHVEADQTSPSAALPPDRHRSNSMLW